MNYSLTDISLTQDDQKHELTFESAVLHVITEFHERGWFVQISGMHDPEFAESLFATGNIAMYMHAHTAEGVAVHGQCYVHPQMNASGVNMKGEGPLFGYEQLERTT